MLLFSSISKQERQNWADSLDQPLMSFAEVEEYTRQMRLSWEKYEQTILDAMFTLYGVEFKKPVIDVFVSPWNKSISNPIILNPSRPPEIHIETLTHELLHGLFTDNNAFSMHDTNQSVKLIDEWKNLFGAELEWKTLVHIPIHAGLKAIFLDTLHAPERLERDITRHQNNLSYKAAWDYVEEHGYEDINSILKDLYAQLLCKQRF